MSPSRRRQSSALLEELTDIAGAAAAEALVRDFGGRDIYVPMAPGENHPLTVSVGIVAAARLVDAYGGINLRLPLPRDKAQRILELARDGVRPREIARQVHCTERWVQRVRKAAREDADPAQASLFPPN